MLGENVRRLLRRVLKPETVSPGPVATSWGTVFRRSNGLREFWKDLDPEAGLHILDLGSASQANISFVTGRGYKLYTEDLFRTVVRSVSQSQAGAEEWSEERFFRDNLRYTEGQFDGVLCWDLLDFLDDYLAKPLVERLYAFVKPGSHLLVFFHTAPSGQEVPIQQYRIAAEDRLEILGRGSGKLRRHFNNRAIENLFRKFASLKFYLSQDNLREVVIVR